MLNELNISTPNQKTFIALNRKKEHIYEIKLKIEEKKIKKLMQKTKNDLIVYYRNCSNII